ncbi:MAG TPA: M12 family metallopeptidase [Blastocatellia bacterium]|nr:M12 family metallopeptidase [Blastocatellia bacterium]
MTIKQSFVRLNLVLLCLFSLGFVALRAVHGQKPQPPVKQEGNSEDYVIIEGDIEVSRAQYEKIIAARFAPQSAHLPRADNLWPKGIIPFQFDNLGCPTGAPATCVSAANQTAMFNTLALLEAAVTTVDFRQCPGNKCTGNFVHIQNDTRNSSPVGVQGGSQTLRVTSWGSPFIIMHELLHCLGFYHEQSRPDRDNFITINCGNIRGDSGDCKSTQAMVDFNKQDDASVYGYYDYDSLMHYSQCSFSIGCGTNADGTPKTNCLVCPKQETLTVKAPYDGNPPNWQINMGQRTHLSNLDQLTLSFLYPRGNWRFVDLAYKGSRGESDGTFLRPYKSLEIGINATPVGGTLWLQPGFYSTDRGFTKRITIRAPLGDVFISKGPIFVGPPGLTSVSAASYNGELAAESIVASFGQNLAAGTAFATGIPLPTQLAGATVKVKDALGVERDAPLFFVSPNQINYQIPSGASGGIATITVYDSSGKSMATGMVPITMAAPALFSANSSGQGVPAASVLRVRGDTQLYESVARYDAQLQQFVPAPIDLGPEGDLVFLILYGAGFRAAGAAGVTVKIGDEEAELLYAGAAPGFVGLDQANVRIPRNLIGKGEVTIQLTADNRSANTVTINIR